MNIFELYEKDVTSSWMLDIANSRSKKITRLTLSDGKVYLIYGLSRYMFDQWVSSPSKGKFFHTRIKDRFKISRIQ